VNQGEDLSRLPILPFQFVPDVLVPLERIAEPLLPIQPLCVPVERAGRGAADGRAHLKGEEEGVDADVSRFLEGEELILQDPQVIWVEAAGDAVLVIATAAAVFVAPLAAEVVPIPVGGGLAAAVGFQFLPLADVASGVGHQQAALGGALAEGVGRPPARGSARHLWGK